MKAYPTIDFEDKTCKWPLYFEADGEFLVKNVEFTGFEGKTIVKGAKGTVTLGEGVLSKEQNVKYADAIASAATGVKVYVKGGYYRTDPTPFC